MKSDEKTAKKAYIDRDRKTCGLESSLKSINMKKKVIRNKGIGKMEFKRMKNSPHGPSVFKGVRNVVHLTIVIPFVSPIDSRLQSSKSKLP